MRVKAKTDLLFLCQGVLLPSETTKTDYPLYRHLFNWMKYHERSKNRAILLPRSHRKSTYATKADALQIALPDDLGTCPYPRNLGPNVRICIAHESSIMAERMLMEIQRWVMGSEMLHFLFPEIIPEKGKQRINNSELELKRQATWSEPTFDTMGVGTKAQGRHYNRIKLDDIYGPEARDSKAVREKTIMWFDEIEPFLVTPKTDGFDLIGTRYAFDDVYQHAFNKYGDDLPRYVRSVIEFDSVEGRYTPIFPEFFDEETLKHLKKNRKVWTSNYLNNPAWADAEFQPDWIRYYEKVGPQQIVAFTGEKHLKRHYEELDRLILIDPAVTGDAGWAVTGTDYVSNKPNVFVLEAERRALPPEIIIEKIFNAVLRYNPRAVVIESVLFSTLYKNWLESEMRHRGIYFTIVEAKTRQKEKDTRVRALSPYFAAGQIYLHQDQTALLEEYNQFGLGEKYHILDALAYGPENWRASVNRELIQRQKDAERRFLEMRDPRTGYTRVG